MSYGCRVKPSALSVKYRDGSWLETAVAINRHSSEQQVEQQFVSIKLPRCVHRCRMGLAGFPNTSAAPQQGQFHAGQLGAAGAAGLTAQQVMQIWSLLAWYIFYAW